MLHYNEFPIGHPVLRQVDELVNWRAPDDVPGRGIYKVVIVPPQDLFVPVLPLRVSRARSSDWLDS